MAKDRGEAYQEGERVRVHLGGHSFRYDGIAVVARSRGGEKIVRFWINGRRKNIAPNWETEVESLAEK